MPHRPGHDLLDAVLDRRPNLQAILEDLEALPRSRDRDAATLEEQLADAEARVEEAQAAVREARATGTSSDQLAAHRRLQDARRRVRDLRSRIASRDAPGNGGFRAPSGRV